LALSALVTQGSSFLATLGFEPESLWDSSNAFPKGMSFSPVQSARAEKSCFNSFSLDGKPLKLTPLPNTRHLAEARR
jgi:hypothetical protein